ncbi:hypothetical protein C3941_23735 [Kaistia algarum]|uniref:hypothetical protein n=1 Tax=Kaistia algarum TaxID=2083279 RepID=UPI000CE92355|nr:hypothetical protein [Kaistia algarum]MCX5513404.1 hypothetical protein [Kaistia algarum]PPE77410.1 hypothetical protein C3941_23735 [Kaistia algarum]
MSERARAFLDVWTTDLLDRSPLLMSQEADIHALIGECVGEASFIGIDRAELDQAAGDLAEFLNQRLKSCPGIHTIG